MSLQEFADETIKLLGTDTEELLVERGKVCLAREISSCQLIPACETTLSYRLTRENYEAGAAGALLFGEAVFFAGILFFGRAVLVATVFPEVDFAAFLDFAQRAFCAAAIFARASGLKVRTAFTFARGFVGSSLASLGRPATPAGRPGFFLAVLPAPAKSAFACCNREISASIWTTISFVFKVSSYYRE
jgi:hypothetical protein